MASVAQSLLAHRFYQMGYVTNDFDRALAGFADTAGITRFFERRGQSVPVGPGSVAVMDIGLAHVGGVEIEIIRPLSGAIEIYQHVLEEPDFAIQLHHQGLLAATIADLDAARTAAEAGEFEIVIDSSGSFGENIQYFYADTRGLLGHYIEYLYYDAETLGFFDTMVPQYELSRGS